MVLSNLIKYNKNKKWYEFIDNNNKDYLENIEVNIESNEKSNIINNFEKTIEELLYDSNTKTEDITTINFSINNEKVLEMINNIITNKISMKKQIALQILRNQNFIITYISKYIAQSKLIDYNYFLKLLIWLKDASNELAKRLNMKKIKFNYDKTKISKSGEVSYIPSS